VPLEWLGQAFIDEANFLKEVNPDAYEHEYLGIASAVGGLVFENVEIRKITDEEISQFDRVLNGLDWGYYPDPAQYNKVHYDAARMTLYIFGEYRGWKHSNRELYDKIIEVGYDQNQLLIPDSAEPKSIADFRSYGASVRGAEKGPESVRYSMKWLQSLRKIVIDNVRCPYTADEFLNYELDQNKDGDYISEYPDKDNHAIDSCRYACNRIWKRRGQ
jgi:phage terminase large subunit